MKHENLFHILSLFFISRLFFEFSTAVDTIAPNQTLPDNGTTIVSLNENFELGFFSPRNSNNRYVGIWFKKVPEQTVVWVANREDPISDSSGVLTITSSGTIIISSNKSSLVWTANSTSRTVSNAILKLLDNGNLIVKNDTADDDNPESFLWQSFDFPYDTLIPGMKLGWNLRTNQEWYLRSWRSTQDASPGNFTFRMSSGGLPSAILYQGSTILFRTGPWDGVRFGDSPELRQNTVYRPIFVFDSDIVYYAFENSDESIISRFVVNQSGELNHFMWSPNRNQWIQLNRIVVDSCDEYAMCGNNSVCDIDKSPDCACLTGFTPRLSNEWAQFDWEGGCGRRTPLNCSRPVGFRKFLGLKYPETSDSVVNRTLTRREDCEVACLRNCSCMAYATTDVSGCAMWFGDLVDLRFYAQGGHDLFVRMPKSELDSSNKSKKAAVIASVTVASFLLFLTLIIGLVIRMIKRDQQHYSMNQDNNHESIGDEDLDLPLFDFFTISAATDGFSCANKLGEGGFGPVYKGVLSTGQEIAVKTLSKDSGQGLEEFKNEVIFIAKLQHRNLVRLLGCCIHKEERMLVYEYMPNKSLDLFIFNQSRDTSLHWQTRSGIMVGVARGLLYLHRDSRLRIIHRDLKASNILLDAEMNPKISDFGLARTFAGDQHQENTKRIIGTHGYMAPEYAVDGLFSVKSDVFSFGVLVLEILSGKRNRGFYHPDHNLNLLGHAWTLWDEGNPLDILDTSLMEPKSTSEVLRFIQVGLLCVQQRPEDRPTMSNVLLMLDSEHPVLAQPKQPGFYTQRTVMNIDSSSTGQRPRTSNEITVTLLEGR